MRDSNDPIAHLTKEAIRKRAFTGAAILIARGGDLYYRKIFGLESSDGNPITDNHLFDLASLTKPIVTVSLLLHMINSGVLSPFTKIKEILPGHWAGNFRDTEIFELISHRSGLPAYHEYYRKFIRVPCYRRKERLIRNILKHPCSPDKTAVYSDLGYIVLGYIIEKIYEESLDKIFDFRIVPYFSSHTEKLTFAAFDCPLTICLKPATKYRGCSDIKFVHTSFCKWRNRRIFGEVEDANAFCIGGVSGHAGLFGTVDGVYSWLLHLWEIYTGKAVGICSRELLDLFWQKRNDGHSWVAGFDTPSRDSDIVSPYFSSHSIGHYGFTGTSFWLDLTDGFAVIILTNRTYYGSTGVKIKAFRREIHQLARAKYGE